MHIRRRDIRPRGTPSRATHPRDTHRSMPPSTANHRRSSNSNPAAVPASWKDGTFILPIVEFIYVCENSVRVCLLIWLVGFRGRIIDPRIWDLGCYFGESTASQRVYWLSRLTECVGLQGYGQVAFICFKPEVLLFNGYWLNNMIEFTLEQIKLNVGNDRCR